MGINEVIIYHNYDQIAIHRKANYEWEGVKKNEYSPPNKQYYLETTSVGIKNWSKQIGESTYLFVLQLLNQKGVDGLRPARCVCRLESNYGAKRLERACKRALFFNLYSYIWLMH
ncbi:MAG: hypothetical protein MJB14_22905 [Spirochaetes bacterium]|nr:hypothetical protein [Spirochaetota bacterium]